eukprot:GCRY01001564.1.p1 GENE.GCRY01001564.1~~GCRY01001564.1.p1  ORF type:complete len:366 (+),score=40.95 GCRY01001564.1:246-1343(+)
MERSFRQVGVKKDGGQVYKGWTQKNVNGDSSGYHSSSIPSKYETVIHRTKAETSEKKGFGSTTQRFQAIQSGVTIGPGDYFAGHQSLESKSDSFSKKGFGAGFCSKSSRFESDFRQRRLPGPGSYNTRGSLEKATPLSSKGSSGFVPSYVPDTLKQRVRDPLPGPSDYNIPRTLDDVGSPTVHAKATSQFRSKTERLPNFTKEAFLPGPGAYHLEWPVTSPPKAIVPFSTTSKKCPPLSTMGQDTPGVGTYNLDNTVHSTPAPPFPGRICRILPSKIFGPDPNTQRAIINRRSTVTEQPGPASYEVPRPFGDSGLKLTEPSAPFCTSNRFKDSLSTQQPGPGTYNISRDMNKQSFHVNLKGDFVR